MVTVADDDLAVAIGRKIESSSEFDSSDDAESESEPELCLVAVFGYRSCTSGLLLTDMPESELKFSCRCQESFDVISGIGDDDEEAFCLAGDGGD